MVVRRYMETGGKRKNTFHSANSLFLFLTFASTADHQTKTVQWLDFPSLGIRNDQFKSKISSHLSKTNPAATKTKSWEVNQVEGKLRLSASGEKWKQVFPRSANLTTFLSHLNHPSPLMKTHTYLPSPFTPHMQVCNSHGKWFRVTGSPHLTEKQNTAEKWEGESAFFKWEETKKEKKISQLWFLSSRSSSISDEGKNSQKRYFRKGSVHKLSLRALTRKWCSQTEFSCSFKREECSPLEAGNWGCVHRQIFLRFHETGAFTPNRKAEPFSLYKTPGKKRNGTTSIEGNEGGFTSMKISNLIFLLWRQKPKR